MKGSIYLSGPIGQTDFAGASNWYRRVREALSPDIRLFMPMRFAWHLEGSKGEIGSHTPETPVLDIPAEHRRHDEIFGTRAAIAGADRFDCQRADLVLMNLEQATRVSIGCMIEAGWADAARVPIILVAQPGNPHAGHPILEHLATWRVRTLEEACAVVRLVLDP